MGSLTAHLVEAGDHGRLRFHPSCPVCREERLFGTLSSEPVVSRRAQALLAGGVLALSTSGPVGALAQEPDRQFEGVAAPEQSGETELDDPTFDPGGDTGLSFDTAPAPAAPGDGADSGEGAPLDVEPSVDLDAGLAPLADAEAPGADQEAAVPPVEAVPPAGAQAPGASVTPGAPAAPNPGYDAPSGEGDQRPVVDERPDRGPVHFGSDRATYEREVGAKRPAAGAPVPAPGVGDEAAPQPYVEPVAVAPVEAAAPVSVAPVPAAEPVAAAQTTAPAPDTSKEQPLDGNARSYVVQPGDSLWSIANRLLGGHASPAWIAREVHRLWSLNSSRIGTGNPNLLIVGTRLQLR
jgi:LysM domain